MLKDELRKSASIGVLLSCGLGMAACNTIEGAGEDIQSAGEAIEEEAED